MALNQLQIVASSFHLLYTGHMNSLGLRHLALNVRDAQIAKEFYCRVLKMSVEWEPDADNVYLHTGTATGGALDNLALHKSENFSNRGGALDHLGFFVPTMQDVDAWFSHVKNSGAKILKPVKIHRDGAKSFYFEDMDGNVIQILYHKPISG